MKNINNIDFWNADSNDYAHLYEYLFENGNSAYKDEFSALNEKTSSKKTDVKNKRNKSDVNEQPSKLSDEEFAVLNGMINQGISQETLDSITDYAKNNGNTGEKVLKVFIFLAKMVNSASSSLLASTLDNFTLGNMKEALCDIYKNKKLNSMSEDEIEDVREKLHKMPEFERAKKQYVDAGQRIDDNTNTDVDESTTEYACLWYSGKKNESVLRILNQLVEEIQKQAKAQEQQIADLKKKVKSMKISGVGDEEVDKFGPIISSMIKDGKTPKEISKKISGLKSGINESYQLKLRHLHERLLLEGRTLITEHQKKTAWLETLCESSECTDFLAQYLLNEGFFDKVKSGLKGVFSKAASFVPEKFKAKIKDLTGKALESLKNGSLAPILKIAGIGFLALTGAWGIALIVATMMLIEKHGKQLKYAMDRAWSRFADSKGVIAKMNFSTKGEKESHYSARFYSKDLTWRIINRDNANKRPSLEFSKEILTTGAGKKFVDYVISLWDPVFSPEKGGKINFADLLKQSKNIEIPEKQLQMLEDFRKNYEQIRTNFLKPQIDTRTQKL